MARTKIFVSFEYKTGYELKETLIGQAEQPDARFPLRISPYKSGNRRATGWTRRSKPLRDAMFS